MNVRTKLRTAAIAATLGIVMLTSPSGLVLAAPKETPEQSCKRRGFYWDDRLGCLDKTCQSGGKTYKPGDIVTFTIRTRNGPKQVLGMCDGFTGNVVMI
ncbi:MAG: hypothetical protein IT306_16265 [Chloroflexi bacterium]|nr:hypothetical protein [Chloroflexota bacterium]